MRFRAEVKRLPQLALGDRSAWLYAARLCWQEPKAPKSKPEISLVTKFVDRGEVVVDIGANGADWTYALSRQVGSAGHVFAFEADPFYAEVTRRAISLMNLKNVTFFSFGLSDVQETAHLLIKSDDNERMAGISRIVREANSKTKDKTVKVRLERLDDLAASHSELWLTRFIKCDVEGFELMVFRGGKNVVRRARPLIFAEVGSAHLHGYDDHDLFHFFSELKYRFYAISSDGTSLHLLSEGLDIPVAYVQEILMVPEEVILSKELLNEARG